MQQSRRHFIASGVALGAALPFLRSMPAAAAPIPPHLLHPELRAIVPQVEKFASMAPPMTREYLPKMRGSKNPFSQSPLTDVPWERRVVPVGKPHPDVAIYIVNANPGMSRPAILHAHGGGYVTGSAESSIHGLQQICKALDCVAVSVDYRLAPETTYAGSVEDNYAGLKWLYANAASLGVDPTRIAVMGESAGGGHAAILALVARDRGEVPLCFQCLIYPMLDDRTGTSRKVPPHVGTLIWDPAKNKFGWESFLGGKAGGARAPALAVPARVNTLKGLPPTFIGVGTLDLFCDEDIDYGQRLSAEGVLCETIVVQGAFHGFDAISKMAGLPLGKWFEAAKLNALRRGFGMAAV